MENTQQTEQVFHNLQSSSSFPMKVLILFFVAIILGTGTGYVLAKRTNPSVTQSSNSSTTSVVKGAAYGTNDTSTFKDTAEGVVQKGGINGEGQFHLVRPGGDSQNVYMTSSTVDLSQFVGHKVKVWGATQKAQYAGWLMDIGKVEVEN